MSDHDLTPCNASPSPSQHLPWGGAGSGTGGMVVARGHFEQDEFEEMWKEHVHAVMQGSGVTTENHLLLKTFGIFASLFNVIAFKL